MRKLATAAAVSLALASGGAFGLGLGDIEMRSALNQPMNAEIRLTSARPAELDGMIVKLADAEAFERAGIERTAVLTSLRFAVENVGDRAVIRVTSPRPVVEPFLNFLLEVDWPQGRMVREYTVLLDPPVFMTEGPSRRDDGAEQGAVVDNDRALVAPAPIKRSAPASDEVELADGDRKVDDESLLGGTDNAAADAAGAATGADAAGEIVSLDELQADSAALEAGSEVAPLADAGAPNTDASGQRSAALGDGAEVAPAEAGPAGGAGNGTRSAASGDAVEREVLVERGDTLYEIAEDNLAEQTTVEQMMLALLDANRSAFINDNINLVRAGSILRVPRGAEARALSQAQALAEISRQSDLWREYRDNLRGTTADTRIANRGEAATGDASGSPEVADAGAGADVEAGGEAADTLTPEAREILESARAEVRGRDELRIVADDTSSTIGVNATVESDDTDRAGRLGEINRQLQLAREELSSSRLEGNDLGEQASELQNTSENLDALVALRQNEIARLETQLAAARANGDDTGAGDVSETEERLDTASESDAFAPAGDDDVTTSGIGEAGGVIAEASGDVAEGSLAEIDESVNRAGESLAEAGDDTVAMVDRAAEEAGDASGAASESGEDGENAIGMAGGTPEQLDSIDDAEPSAAGAAGDPATEAPAPAAWYASLLDDPVRLGIAGAGAIGLLGLGALFLRRRGRDEDDELAGYAEGDAEFIDDEASATLQAELDAESSARVAADKAVADEFSAARSSDPATAAAAAGAVAAAASDGVGTAPSESGDEVPANVAEPDKDDTISEVDVYLAYGLHGQAEELLVKANERQPENKVYAAKLLQTYHAQGNAEAFESAAEDFRTRFGDSDAVWDDIAAMGRELRPDSAMFLTGAIDETPETTSRHGESALEDADFIFDNESGEISSSVSRDFSSADESFDFDGEGFESTELDATELDAPTGSGASADSLEFESAAGSAPAEATAPADEPLAASPEEKGGDEDFGSFELSESSPAQAPLDTLGPDDETLLMDQSLDPAFAFDEGDLEATGDFSRIAEEFSAENDDVSIDFPGIDDAPAGGPSPSERELLAEPSDGDSVDAALTLDELDVDGENAASSDAGDDGLELDNLSLDLDQLDDDAALDLESASPDDPALLDEASSGELDEPIDEADPLDMMFDEADPLDMTIQNELLDGTAAPLDSEDEMETMMDLAKAYIDMGDSDSASNALGEVVKSGSPDQVSEAETLLRKIS